MIEWWRSWHGAPTDPKWGVIARVASAPRTVVVALAWTLLDAASKAPVRGDVSGADPEELAVALDVSSDQVAAILDAMRASNPTTGKPRFIGADGRITEWERYQPKREREDDGHGARRGGRSAADGGTVAAGGGRVAEGGATPPPAAPPAPPEDSKTKEPPLTPPAGGDAVDRVRSVVWSKSGLTTEAIQVKLVTTDSNGIRQVRGWFALGLTEARIVATINRAFAEAAEPIRRPWPYLDAVMKAEATKPQDASEGSASGFVSTSVDWRKRLSDFVKCGFWMDGWGEKPGNARCEAPADLLAEFGFGGGHA